MTLIVAKIVDENLRCISDTKVTDRRGEKVDPIDGVLKSVILDPKCFLAYAGINYYAEILLDEFYSAQLPDLEKLINRCLVLNQESNDEIEFCIGYITNNIPKLIKISNKKIEEKLSNLWLGDKMAFDLYQEVIITGKIKNSVTYNAFRVSESMNPELSKMLTPFEDVIADNSIESVGHFLVSIHTVIDGSNLIFMYSQLSKMHIIEQNLLLKNKRGAIEFGGADKGGYGTCYLRSINLFQPAIAIYFPQGKFGIFFYPKKHRNKPIIIRNIANGEAFAFEIKNNYNIDLDGMVESDGSALKRIRTVI
ncbi:MAG: hypothetical protein IPI45_07215 [Saprospiraceae bacterium]|nr:hypothetical protein [Saprospiraceae bacterium]MBK7737551.1 hypothetical protein [Saprospiraceae bacterium]MBK7913864.1 hypothetical protein [Saprospiraceae bacterium]